MAESAAHAPSAKRLRTDSSSFRLRPDGPGWATTIDFTYGNPGPDTVYVVNCNGEILMRLQKRVSGEWKYAWYAEGNQCLSPPIVIPPGETLRGAAGIWGAEPGNPSYNTFRTDELEGEYRLVWFQPVHHYDPTAPRFGDTIPLADRVSNPFRFSRMTSAVQTGRGPAPGNGDR